MALNKYYLIQNATNNLWYTEDHAVPNSDRWSPNILDAYKHTSYADAETEITTDEFSAYEFRIVEILIKS
jgi:hypothetical protein